MTPLNSQFWRADIHSQFLARPRSLTVFVFNNGKVAGRLPVIYCADGQMLPEICIRLRSENLDEGMRSVVIVGVHSDPAFRNEEYLAGLDGPRFRDHQRFFVDEVPAWAAAEFGVSNERQRRALFGVSNGAAFAVATGLAYPEMCGAVIAFSVPRPPNEFPELPPRDSIRPRFYLAAGSRGAEKSFARFTRRLTKRLRSYHINATYVRGDGDHEPGLWQSLLPSGVNWFSDVEGNNRSSFDSTDQ